MKTVLQATSFFLLFLCLLFTQCSKTPDTPVTPKSSTKTLTIPTIDGVTGASITFDAATSTYTVTVPSGTDVTGLKVSFTLPTGATSKPTVGSAQNFTNPVVYTVTAEDGTTQAYTVKVVVTAAPKSAEKQITAFTFAVLSPVVLATIDQTTRKITATIPASADLTSLVPTLTISAKATVSPASGVVQNFTNLVNYTVTAEDGSKQIYEVRINKEIISNTTTGVSGTVFIGDFEGNLYAIDTDNGQQKWVCKLGDGFPYDVFATPVVGNGNVYIQRKGKIYAVDINTGIKKWTVTGTTTPCLEDGVIFVNNGSGDLKAYDASTGVQKWQSSILYIDASKRTIVKNGIIYACALRPLSAGTKYTVLALDSKTGKKIWEFLSDSFF